LHHERRLLVSGLLLIPNSRYLSNPDNKIDSIFFMLLLYIFLNRAGRLGSGGGTAGGGCGDSSGYGCDDAGGGDGDGGCGSGCGGGGCGGCGG
jgi:hypothetical protein